MHFKIVTTKETANEIKEWFDVISDKKNKIRSSCRLDRIEHSEQFSEVTITANDGWKVKPEDVFRLGYNCRNIDYKELAKAIKNEELNDPTANWATKDFINEAKQVRHEFGSIVFQYNTSDHIQLRTESDSLLIMYDQMMDRIKKPTDPTANIPEKDRQFIDKMIAELRESGYSYDDMCSIFREAGRKYQDFKSRMEKIGVKASKKTQS